MYCFLWARYGMMHQANRVVPPLPLSFTSLLPPFTGDEEGSPADLAILLSGAAACSSLLLFSRLAPRGLHACVPFKVAWEWSSRPSATMVVRRGNFHPPRRCKGPVTGLVPLGSFFIFPLGTNPPTWNPGVAGFATFLLAFLFFFFAL